jgi:multiple antibiotic resistance protein
MTEVLAKFLEAFIPIFVAIDPVGLAAIFLGLGRGLPLAARQRVARQATLTGGGVALLFVFLGQSIFLALGITVQDFQIAGGLILFILAAREITLSGSVRRERPAGDFGVVPLGMPLIAGPALITTLLLLTRSHGLAITLTALAVNLGLVVLTFAGSEFLGRTVGSTGLRAVSKVIALLLAAIAVSMIRRGLGV